MDQFLRELYTSRICSGKVKINKMYYRTPSQEEFYGINEEYFRLNDEALSMGLYPSAEHFLWICDNKFWSKKEEDDYKQLLKELDNLKVNLFQIFYKNSEKKILKAKLDLVKQEIDRLHTKKHLMDHLSVDHYIRINKLKLTVGLGLHKDGKKIFRSLSHVKNTSRAEVIENAFVYLLDKKITELQYRDLARNDPWKSIWSCKETGKLFDSVIDITDEQRQLILCSMMYDNVYKHSECPSDDVISDDDCLDGWMILQRRKRKAEEGKNVLDGILTNEKIKNSQEICIVSDGSKEELDKIESFNDATSLRAKKERFDFLAKKGNIEEQYMPDSQRKMREMINGNPGTNKR